VLKRKSDTRTKLVDGFTGMEGNIAQSESEETRSSPTIKHFMDIWHLYKWLCVKRT